LSGLVIREAIPIAERAFEGARTTASVGRASSVLFEEFYALSKSFKIPPGWVGKEAPFKLVVNHGPQMATSLRLAPKQVPTITQLQGGDTVLAKIPGLGSAKGELLRFGTDESKNFALVKVNDAITGMPVVRGLTPFNNTLWRSESGHVFSTERKLGIGVPEAADVRQVKGALAVEKENLKFLGGHRPLLPEAYEEVKRNGELIVANQSSRDGLLFSLASAPKYQFRSSPLLDWTPPSVFNPALETSNCMACTAGVLRTLSTGRLTTARDIAAIKGPNGELGFPFRGRFKDIDQALDWFDTAAGVTRTGVHSIENMVAGKPYALTMSLNSDLSQSHMAFAYKLQSGRRIFFDAQAGARYDPRSFSQKALAPLLYPLEFVK